MKISSQHMRRTIIFGTALIIGFLLAFQFRSFALVKETFLRDKNPNIFRELQILKGVNVQLSSERASLEQELLELKTRVSSTEILRKEEEKYRMLSGEESVSGPGVRILLPKTLITSWFTDLINELVSAGVEAIAINGVRITNQENGFRTIGETTLLLGDRVLHPPFVVEAIGDSKLLSEVMLQTGSVIHRMEKTIKNLKIELSKEEKLIFGQGT